MTLARIDARVCLWLVAALCACSGDAADIVKLNDRDAMMGGNGGSGSMDGGGAGRDGGNLLFDGPPTMDAKVLGLDADLELPDGSLILPDGAIRLPDGAIIDVETAIRRYTPELDVSTCMVMEDNAWQTPVDLRDEGGFALVPGQVGFGLAFQAIGTAGTCAHNVDTAHIPASMGFPTPQAVLTECKAITDVTLLSEDAGWRLAWVDNFTNMAELHTVMLDSDMQIAEGQTRRTLTDNQYQFESKPVLERIDGRPLLAWITRATMANMTHKHRITTQYLDDTSSARDVVTDDSGHQPQALALAQMGTRNAALAWVGPTENPGVWLQKLDENAVKVGTPIKLSDKVAASSSVSVAGRDNGGGVVYSIEIDGMPQVRFRRLDEAGEPLGVERPVIAPPLRAMGASIATLGGGYVVSYRALPGSSITEPEIHVLFLSKEGNVMRDAGGNLLSWVIAPATIASGRTTVSVSVEGQIMLAWVDADATSDHNILKVARRRLDCM